MSSGLDFPDDFLEQHYHDERADSGTNVSYSPRAPFMQRVHSGFSQPDHHSNTPHTTFRGKLLSLKTTKKTRGSSYRGRLSSSRGSFQTRGFRGSYRSRSGGHSNHRSSSYHRTFKDNSSYDKRWTGCEYYHWIILITVLFPKISVLSGLNRILLISFLYHCICKSNLNANF